MTGCRAAAVALMVCVAAERAGAQAAGSKNKIQKDPPAAVPGALSDGKQIYALTCAACHQPGGEGMPEKYPPLASSEWVQGSEDRLLAIVLRGLTGEIEVQGEVISGAMPGWAPLLKDSQIAAVATYVRVNFGNAAAPVTAAAVARVRKATASRKTPYTVAELPK